MKNKVSLIARILLGLMFTVFGADGVMRAVTGNGFFPMPPMKPEMATVMSGLLAMKYLFPLAKFIELIAGLLLLCNRYVNFAIVILTPVVVNIVGINTFVDASGAPMALVILALLMVVIYSRWDDFRPLLKK
jgi:putative oxidoreductase